MSVLQTVSNAFQLYDLNKDGGLLRSLHDKSAVLFQTFVIFCTDEILEQVIALIFALEYYRSASLLPLLMEKIRLSEKYVRRVEANPKSKGAMEYKEDIL